MILKVYQTYRFLMLEFTLTCKLPEMFLLVIWLLINTKFKYFGLYHCDQR